MEYLLVDGYKKINTIVVFDGYMVKKSPEKKNFLIILQ